MESIDLELIVFTMIFLFVYGYSGGRAALLFMCMVCLLNALKGGSNDPS